MLFVKQYFDHLNTLLSQRNIDRETVRLFRDTRNQKKKPGKQLEMTNHILYSTVG